MPGWELLKATLKMDFVRVVLLIRELAQAVANSLTAFRSGLLWQIIFVGATMVVVLRDHPPHGSKLALVLSVITATEPVPASQFQLKYVISVRCPIET